MAESSSVLKRSALGRDGFLGDLYDAYSDQFCGLNIFKSSPPDDLFQRQDTNNSDIQYSMSDTLSEKFDKLNVEGALKLSFIAKFLPLGSGSGQYINDGNKSRKCVRSSLIYRVQTRSEQFNFLNTDIGKYIDFNALKNTNATHIVQKINWGANAVVTMEALAESDDDLKNIKANIEVGLKFIGLTVEGKFEKTNETKSHNRNYHLKIVADVLPDTSLPQTVEDALEFIGKIPKLIEKSNNGSGKPLVFFFIPINEVRRMMELSDMKFEIVLKELGDHQVVEHVAFFEQITTLQQKIYDKVSLIKEKEKCLKRQYLNDALTLQMNVLTFENQKKDKLSKELIAYRKGEINFVNVMEYEEVQKFEERLQTLQPALGMIRRYDMFIKLGAVYLGSDSNLDNELIDVDVAFILFISESFMNADKELFFQNINTFVSLIKNSTSNGKFIVCDLDLSNHRDVTAVCIWHSKDGVVLSKNYLADNVSTNGYNYMYCDNYTFATGKPNKRAALNMICPCNLHNGPCELGKKFWQCPKCKEDIEYGFDSYFYCNCGKGKCEDYRYRCAHEKHVNYLSLDKNILNELLKEMRLMKELNILVLGSTGVGKSTWLNSIVNYLTYDSLTEAQEGGVRCVIPISFTISNDQLEEQTVTLGDVNDAEVLQAGHSATQEPKSYTFTDGTTLVRFIDTPGIGDVRGLDQDKENLKGILEHISYLDELHGICILLKPNEARLSVLFRFCIKELLANLHKSASQNIIFCFTNARSTFYRPGDTLPVLNALLKELSFEVVVSKHTVYCLDNESFRFLCTLKYPSITYDDCEKECFQTSWVKSVMETKRMFQHIEQLPPHKTTDTITLNESRRLILTLTKPMAEITKTIKLNVAAIEDKKRMVREWQHSEKELLKKLYIPRITLKPKALGYPRTVCTSAKCIEYREMSCGVKEIRYKQICHDNCGVSEVVPETHPNIRLRSCCAMNGESCRHCYCRWEDHIHITYSQEQVEEKVENELVKDEIKAKKTAADKIEEKIREMEDRVTKYNEEQKQIRDVSVQFGTFLKIHAIAPYNDAMKAYLELQIQQEQNKIDPSDNDKKVLEGLKDHLRLYEEERITLENLMDNADYKVISSTEVKDLVKKLYNLPLTGKMLQENANVANKCNKKAMQYNEQVVSLTSNYSGRNVEDVAPNGEDRERGWRRKLKLWLGG